MKEYEDLIEALVGMAKITRPRLNANDSPEKKRQNTIQHGICDLLEDAAVAIDALMNTMKGKSDGQERTHATATD